MNVSQTNHPLQQPTANDSAQVVSELTDSDAFLNQLNLAQQGHEWFTETDVRTEKERVYEEKQAHLRESEDFEDDLLAGLAGQGYVNDLKQADTMENARVITAAENRERLMQHVEKKHLHTPTVIEDGVPENAENQFSKVIAGELEGGAKGATKEASGSIPRAEIDELAGLQSGNRSKTAEAINPDMTQRFDASLVRGMKSETTGKAAAKMLEGSRLESSRIGATEAAGSKATAKTSTARVMSISGLQQASQEGNKTEAALKTARPDKPQTPVNIKDVMGTVKVMISSKTNEMVMKLAPEHLGKLEIRLKKDGDKLIGRFKVDSREAREAIELQLPQLKEGLAEQGIQLEEITVLVNGEESSNQSFAFSQERDGESGISQKQGDDSNSGNAISQPGETTAGNTSGTDSGLNIYA